MKPATPYVRCKSFCLFLLMSSSFSSLFAVYKNPIATTYQGNISKEGWVTIVELNGPWREMGMQYGSLLKSEIHQIYDVFVNGFFAKYGVTFNELKTLLYDRSWNGVSQRQKELFRGASLTSGMTVEQLFVLDQIQYAFILLRNQIQFGIKPEFGCSFMATWGDYSKTGELVLGRNLDWFPLYKELSELLTVVVYNPIDGSIPTANIGYVGFLGSTLTAINKNGVMAEINSGMTSMGHVSYNDRSSMTNELLGMLLDSESLETLERRAKTIRTDFPLILNIANGSMAYSVEDAPTNVMTRKTQAPGVLVSTNKYLIPEWGLPLIEDPSYPIKRYQNLEKLAKIYKGDFNSTTMQEVFDLPLVYSDGTSGPGVTVYNNTLPGDPTETIYSIVSILDPKPIFWIQVPGDPIRKWQQVDVYKYFK